MTTTEFYASIDQLTSKVKNCCAKGCFACCDEPAVADVREVDAMLALLTPEETERVKQRTSEWIVRFHPFMDVKRPPAIPYRELKLTCPLLENGLCMGYEARPFGCRTCLAKSNPKNCSLPMRKHQKYAVVPPMLEARLILPFCVDGFELDHIGVILANRLLGTSIKSATYMSSEELVNR